MFSILTITWSTLGSRNGYSNWWFAVLSVAWHLLIFHIFRWSHWVFHFTSCRFCVFYSISIFFFLFFLLSISFSCAFARNHLGLKTKEHLKIMRTKVAGTVVIATHRHFLPLTAIFCCGVHRAVPRLARWSAIFCNAIYRWRRGNLGRQNWT